MEPEAGQSILQAKFHDFVREKLLAVAQDRVGRCYVFQCFKYYQRVNSGDHDVVHAADFQLHQWSEAECRINTRLYDHLGESLFSLFVCFSRCQRARWFAKARICVLNPPRGSGVT